MSIKNNLQIRNLRHFRIAQGLCRDCGTPAVTGRNQCKFHLSKTSEYRRKRQEKNPAFYMYSNAKRRAKMENLPFDLYITDIQIPELCPIFGIPLYSSKKFIQDNSPTLDRVIPELGYVKGNVVVMSRRANRLKNNATLEELILLGNWARDYAIR